jgi:hypothetical protein
MIGILVSIPFLFMVKTNDSPNQCTLKITKLNLIYVFAMNLIFIFLPTFGLTIFYICIILNTKRRNNSFIRIFSFSKKSKYSLRSQLTENSVDSNKSNIKIIKKRSLTNRKDNIIVLFSKKKQFSSESSNFLILANGKRNTSESLCMPILKNSQNIKPKNKLSSTIKISLVTIFFFFCQLPIRVFICWLYYSTYFLVFQKFDHENFKLIDQISNVATLVYFLHCISNPIIYNILSYKFRTAFLSFLKAQKLKLCSIFI